MNTPIYDFVEKYNKSKAKRFHMPGHKGIDSILNIEHLDITEFDGADNLWDPNGIISESENNASNLFGSHTFYSTEGSSLVIRAMLFMVKKWALINNMKPYILAARNVHKTFINTAAILDLEVDWLMQKPEDSYQCCTITKEDVEEYMQVIIQKEINNRELAINNSKKTINNEQSNLNVSADIIKRPVALYVTSPDYLGNMLDIKSLSEVCHKYGILLIVDNAHGAYLKFLKPSMHPIDLGADMCADSAHKTLPALTGAAYLHISKTANAFFKDNAKSALELFASTSPSYLIMQSLDLCNAYLSSVYEPLSVLTRKVKNIKYQLLSNGYVLKGDEPIKITVDCKKYGYTGDEIAEILIEKNIFLEYHDDDYIVIMITTKTSDDDLTSLVNALCDIPRKEEMISVNLLTNADSKKPFQAMSFKDALFADFEVIDGKDAVGRILAEPTVSCPPCVPIYMCGERIDHIFTEKKIKVVK